MTGNKDLGGARAASELSRTLLAPVYTAKGGTSVPKPPKLPTESFLTKAGVMLAIFQNNLSENTKTKYFLSQRSASVLICPLKNKLQKTDLL